MRQYLELLQEIKNKGVYKPSAREGMPGSQSYFGPQFRFNLQEGFPILTTKKIKFEHIVYELLWFLKGDINIKYLVDNGVNIWNEDAYNYYKKKCRDNGLYEISYDSFLNAIKKNESMNDLNSVHGGSINGYNLGDCGYQYGKVWRKWRGFDIGIESGSGIVQVVPFIVDQIKNVIKSLKENPESRRHVVTAIDPSNDKDLALYWCHSMFQFNCRPLSLTERRNYLADEIGGSNVMFMKEEDIVHYTVPKYFLDCKLYQRSADVFLGVPYNISSYALLTHIIAKIVNMIPGEFIHSFGDVHIYDNHKKQVEGQLKRIPTKLPTLKIKDEGNDWAAISNVDFDLISLLDPDDFILEDYTPQSVIKAKLSTGLR